jgi:hypothetical protein
MESINEIGLLLVFYLFLIIASVAKGKIAGR